MRACLSLCATVLFAASLLGCFESAPPPIEIREDQLPSMILGLGDLGPEYVGMTQDEDLSGVMTNADQLEDATDAADEQRDLDQFGRITGYGNFYISEAALLGPGGVFIAGNGVILYETAAGASGDIADQLNDDKREFSGTSDLGSLQSFKTFAPKVAQDSMGIEVRLLGSAADYGTEKDVDVTITGVSFRRDRLVGSIYVLRLDRDDVKADITALARTLDERIRAVLAQESVPEIDSPEAKNPAAVALLARAQEAGSKLQTMRMVQKQTIMSGGQSLTNETDSRLQMPDRSYTWMADPGIEMVVIGVDGYVKAGGAWQCFSTVTGMSLQEFGFNPPDFMAQLDLANIADTVVLLEPKQIGGESLQHVQIRLEATKYMAEVADMIGASGTILEGVQAVTDGGVSIDIYIGDDDLVHQVDVDARLIEAGGSSSVSSSTVISEHNKLFTIPLQPPYPTCR